MFKLFTLLLVLIATAFGNFVPQSSNVDLCPTCVSLMGEAVDQILRVLEGGVVGGCGTVCKNLPNQLEQVACDLICDYVGITEFARVLQSEDPSPIWVCQEFDVCPYTNGGQVNITSTSVQPKSGRQGTEFHLIMDYDVIKHTSVGGLDVTVIPPQGFPISGGKFVMGQAPGHYQFETTIDARPSENQPFQPGLYKVQYAVCQGDCTTKHPHSGVYASAVNTFSISQ